MSRQEDFDTQSDKYVEMRKSFGVNDPYAIKEIGEAHYQGAEYGYQYAKTHPNWQQVRIDAAIAAMPIVADDGYNVRNEQHLIAKYAVELADALIEEIKHSEDVYAECRRLAAINTASVCENMTKIQNELQKKEGNDDNHHQ